MTVATDATLHRIAAKVRPTGTLDAVERIGVGNRTRTVVLRFRDADPIVVQTTPGSETARTEAHLLTEIAERTSVPVPRPIDSGATDGEGWLATPFVGGTDLHRTFTELSADTRRRIARSFGRHLADLHEAFRFDAYGPLTLDDGRLVTETADDVDPIAGGPARARVPVPRRRGALGAVDKIVQVVLIVVLALPLRRD